MTHFEQVTRGVNSVARHRCRLAKLSATRGMGRTLGQLWINAGWDGESVGQVAAFLGQDHHRLRQALNVIGTATQRNDAGRQFRGDGSVNEPFVNHSQQCPTSRQ